MKPVSEMSRLEFAAFVSNAFKENKINVVLSGGSCVSLYSEDKYVSMDLDFVNAAFTKRSEIQHIMDALGFIEENRYFRHPDSNLLVEFPPGPLAVGEESVKQVDELKTSTGTLRIISPTDCVKDRLAWFYHDNDTECLEQAILVAKNNKIDLAEVQRWSIAEGMKESFLEIESRFM